MKTFEGKLVSKSIKVGIVAARFNEFITSKLLSGALDGLLRHEVREDDVHVAWVPGAFEIPLVASKMAKSGRYDAVICLGAVIRGSTSHYDYVCAEVSKGIATVSLQSQIPVLFGVLTTDTIEQANAQGKPVSVCGEMAGDVTMTRLLLGLGLRSFSMHPAQILAVKQELLRADTRKLVPWAQQVLESDDPAQAMEALAMAQEKSASSY